MERILLRPIIHWGRAVRKIVLYVSLSLTTSMLIWYLISVFLNVNMPLIPAFLAAFIAPILLCRVQIIVFLVRIYQRYAPAEMRLACRFEPSCSEYMLLSVEKYGFFRGVWNGLRRIIRCRAPNGGIDYP